MQFSIDDLPAPFGPMMARISCSRISKLMSVSAFTPPNDRLLLSTFSRTSPIFFCSLIMHLSACLAHRRIGLHTGDRQVRIETAGPAVLEGDLGFARDRIPIGIQRFDQLAVAFGDDAPAHLPRAGQLAVI